MLPLLSKARGTREDHRRGWPWVVLGGKHRQLLNAAQCAIPFLVSELLCRCLMCVCVRPRSVCAAMPLCGEEETVSFRAWTSIWALSLAHWFARVCPGGPRTGGWEDESVDGAGNTPSTVPSVEGREEGED